MALYAPLLVAMAAACLVTSSWGMVQSSSRYSERTGKGYSMMKTENKPKGNSFVQMTYSSNSASDPSARAIQESFAKRDSFQSPVLQNFLKTNYAYQDKQQPTHHRAGGSNYGSSASSTSVQKSYAGPTKDNNAQGYYDNDKAFIESKAAVPSSINSALQSMQDFVYHNFDNSGKSPFPNLGGSDFAMPKPMALPQSFVSVNFAFPEMGNQLKGLVEGPSNFMDYANPASNKNQAEFGGLKNRFNDQFEGFLKTNPYSFSGQPNFNLFDKDMFDDPFFSNQQPKPTNVNQKVSQAKSFNPSPNVPKPAVVNNFPNQSPSFSTIGIDSNKLKQTVSVPQFNNNIGRQQYPGNYHNNGGQQQATNYQKSFGQQQAGSSHNSGGQQPGSYHNSGGQQSGNANSFSFHSRSSSQQHMGEPTKFFSQTSQQGTPQGVFPDLDKQTDFPSFEFSAHQELPQNDFLDMGSSGPDFMDSGFLE